MALARDYSLALLGGTGVFVGSGAVLLLLGGCVALGPGLGVGVELPGEWTEAGMSPIIRHCS